MKNHNSTNTIWTIVSTCLLFIIFGVLAWKFYPSPEPLKLSASDVTVAINVNSLDITSYLSALSAVVFSFAFFYVQSFVGKITLAQRLKVNSITSQIFDEPKLMLEKTAAVDENNDTRNDMTKALHAICKLQDFDTLSVQDQNKNLNNLFKNPKDKKYKKYFLFYFKEYDKTSILTSSFIILSMFLIIPFFYFNTYLFHTVKDFFYHVYYWFCLLSLAVMGAFWYLRIRYLKWVASKMENSLNDIRVGIKNAQIYKSAEVIKRIIVRKPKVKKTP